MIQGRQEKEAVQLRGVSCVIDDTKADLGIFERLENWIPVPEGVYSVQKKRGVQALSNVPPAVVVPTTNDCPTEIPIPGAPFGGEFPDGNTDGSGPGPGDVTCIE
jgi:hypothetical protein